MGDFERLVKSKFKRGGKYKDKNFELFSGSMITS
jgi:hypothetical protein